MAKNKKRPLGWDEQTTEDLIHPRASRPAGVVSYARGETSIDDGLRMSVPAAAVAPTPPAIGIQARTVVPPVARPKVQVATQADTTGAQGYTWRSEGGQSVNFPQRPELQQVSDLYSNLKAQGRTVGEMQSGGIMSGDGGTSGTYRAFASWSPEQMAARKAQEDNAPDTALADELTGTIVGKAVPQTGVETRSATAPQVSVPNADASPDYDKNFREATMRAAQDGVRPAHMRDQTLVQRLGLSPYQQAQRRIGVQVTQGNGPRGYVKAPVGLGASQSVGISNNAMPRTKPTGFASENEWQG